MAAGSLSMTSRLLLVAVGLVVVGVGCSSDEDVTASGPAGDGDLPTVPVPQVEEPPREDVPSALDSMDAPELPDPLVETSEIRSGGPPPDGIPPIDDPVFHEAGDVDFLADDEPVLAVEVDGDARAYPVQILMWHEIVNDTFGDRPVTITYCPLCNTAVAFDRRLDDGRVLSFGTSGRLFNSSLVMYDRQTESLWAHFNGEALAGVFAGDRLDRLPVQTISWQSWFADHPEGLVLSRDTGEDRDYGRNPYQGYDDPDSFPFLFDGEVDDRLAAKERLVGFGLDIDPTAVLLEPLLDAGVLHTELDGQPVVVWAERGTSSALETSRVDGGRDVGATGVFAATVDGEVLEFERTDDGFVDDRTGSTWNVVGSAISGPLEGTQLDALEHVDTFWFAWAAFSPDTRVLPES